jgi:hypothetical protein
MMRKLWTDEKPKYSGYYWLKDNGPKVVAEVVYVKKGRVYSTSPDGRKLYGVRVEDVEGKWHPVPFPSLHQFNKHEAKLKELTLTIIDCLAVLDAVMSEHESPQRGQKVAKIWNVLNFANDSAMHGTLGMSFNRISPTS